MNNLIDMAYALRILWSYIKCKTYNFNIKYWILPIIYLFVILLVIPKASVLVNEVTTTTVDSYNSIKITKEDKIDFILEKYNLSKDEFTIISAIVLSEAQANSYEDAYAVINTMYNRTKSKSWTKYISNIYGSNKGKSIYYQAIAPNQFVVYQHGSYKKNLNNTESVGYDAIIDFLYTEEVMHNYLSFRSHNIKIKNSESFSSKGNNYFNVLKNENRV